MDSIVFLSIPQCFSTHASASLRESHTWDVALSKAAYTSMDPNGIDDSARIERSTIDAPCNPISINFSVAASFEG